MNWRAQSNHPSGQEIAKEDLLSFSEFKFATQMALQDTLTIEQALSSGEPLLTTNSFFVLLQFILCFPMVSQHGANIIKNVDKLSKTERPGNIKLLARSYLGLMGKNKSNLDESRSRSRYKSSGNGSSSVTAATNSSINQYHLYKLCTQLTPSSSSSISTTIARDEQSTRTSTTARTSASACKATSFGSTATRSNSLTRGTKLTVDIDRERPEKGRDHREDHEPGREERAKEDHVREERARKDRVRDERLRQERLRDDYRR
ncbi:MAG: hypothetical protein EXX96DRAFT_534618 [Benjaminiella poitrasii]|nr:MAG: hypothetical protein EXX96DRAFT_534618 [Benjaminiella poitrasii]